MLLDIMDSPNCSKVNIDVCVRMLKNLPPVDLKAEMQLKLCKEKDVILKPSVLQQTISFHIEMGKCLCWHNSYTMLGGQIQSAAG